MAITLEEAIHKDALGFQRYVAEYGWDKVSVDDLDTFIKFNTTNVFGWKYFMEIYLAKKAEANNKAISQWTTRVGWLTIGISVMTLVQVVVILGNK